MSRTKLAFTVFGASLAAGAAGWALGVLFAPASGEEMRRRLAWRARDEWTPVARSAERMIERVAERAKTEIDVRTKQLEDAMRCTEKPAA